MLILHVRPFPVVNQCTNENLELFSKALYPIRYMASLYIFVAGCIIAGNIHLAQGFGRGMTAIGAFLIVCSFWNFGSATLMHAGIRRHNKCIILAVRNSQLCTGPRETKEYLVAFSYACSDTHIRGTSGHPALPRGTAHYEKYF